MSSPNVELAREYLRAVESMGPPENVARFCSPDIEFREFPNRIVPHGRVRRRADLQAAYGQAQKLLSSQHYEVKRVVEKGDDVAVELEWTGVLAAPVAAMNLPAGHEMKAYVAMFLTFCEGKIVSQRNYDCYPPFEAVASNAASGAGAASGASVSTAPSAENGNG
jgi:ketosteroid isomerase-like protein